MPNSFDEALLPGLPIDLIRKCYADAPGDEIDSGKFGNPESSAALVANAFGFFLNREAELPVLPSCESEGWPARSISLEAILRFPWAGGHHPCLDVVVQTGAALIGLESKRFEPFRSRMAGTFSEAYTRKVWGTEMVGYERLCAAIMNGSITFNKLDAIQLVKHAFGIRTAVHRQSGAPKKKPVLYYLYAEPKIWPNGHVVPEVDILIHREEVAKFAAAVVGSEVRFVHCSYRRLLSTWADSRNTAVNAHALAVSERFGL